MKTSDDAFLSAVLNALPSPVFVVDDDVRIIKANEAARPLVGEDASTIFLRRAGEALNCLHAIDVPEGCGRGPDCRTCVIRTSVGESFASKKVMRRATKMVLKQRDGTQVVYLLVTTAALSFDGKQYVILTIEDINELAELRRLIPICAACKKIRNEQQYWQSVEDYFKSHLDMDFTHGLCPECVDRLYPGMSLNTSKDI